MIIGIGTDVIEIDRISQKLNRKGFREKIFSQNEILYCNKKGNNSFQSYAGIFVAKEAFLKAVGKGLELTYDLYQIEILHDQIGKPQIKLNGNLTNLYKDVEIFVSISHNKNIALATVVIEGKNDSKN